MQVDKKTRIGLMTLIIAFSFVAYAAAADAAENANPAAPETKTEPKPPSEAAQAILDANPRTPADMARAADLLVELGEPELAKGFLKKIIDANPDRPQLLDLADRFSTAMFIKMAARPELLPEAKQLADKIAAAVDAERNSPQRIAELIEQLGNESPSLRNRASAALRSSGAAAVEPLLRVLADPSQSSRHDAVRTTLAGLGSDAVRPLTAILTADDPALVAQAIRTLSAAGAENSTVYLLAPCTAPESPPAVRSAAAAALLKLVGKVPDREQAARVLANEARNYYLGRVGLGADENGRVKVWQWDAKKRQAAAVDYPAEQAAVVLAERLAREAFLLTPEDKNIRVLRLATMLEKAALEVGIDNPLPTGKETAAAMKAESGADESQVKSGDKSPHSKKEFGVDELQEVVNRSLPPGKPEIHPAAAVAALTILGETGSPDVLADSAGTPSPTARAAHSSDARVRAAAVDAIVALKPTAPFAGSSYAADAMQFAAAGGASRRVMLAGPDSERLRYIVGYLTALGYKVDTAATGGQMLLELAKSPDYEFALIDIATDRPAADLLLQQIRHDWRLAALPVGILAGEESFERAKHVVRNDRLAEAFYRPHDEQSTAWQIEQLKGLIGSRYVPLEIRQRQAIAALDAMARLAAEKNGAIDVARGQASAMKSLRTPTLTEKAAAALAGVGSPQSQRTLVDLASRDTQPIELRKAALTAFRQSIERYGILLTTEEISRQYDRYNQSRDKDKATQAILGQILDCLETPSKGEGRGQRGDDR